jgi:hypothetical protein
MKSKFFIILTLLLLSNARSQSNEIIQKEFFLHFLEEDILTFKDAAGKKDVYDSKKVEIDFDTIGTYTRPYILFLRFDANKNQIKVKDKESEVLLNTTSCSEYLLAITSEGNSYRLKGFNGNDLLFMLKEIHEQSYPQIPYKKILLELNNGNMDINFKAIYKALMNLDFNSKWLKPCNEAKPAHGKG